MLPSLSQNPKRITAPVFISKFSCPASAGFLFYLLTLRKVLMFATIVDMNISLSLVQKIGALVDLIGAITIALGILISTLAVVWHFIRRVRGDKLYDGYRKDLARSILLGLEFLVAGDIIRTVSSQVSIASVLALAGIVAIRSFLGMEFEMELTGKWPWQRKIKHVHKRKKPKTKSKKKR